MARATYTPNAPLLLTNIQYNLTIETPVRALIFVSDSLGELCIDALSTPRSARIGRIGISLEGQRGVQSCDVNVGYFIILKF